RPDLKSLRGCGFAIGIDPSWTHKVSNRNGKIEHSIIGHPVPEGANRLFEGFYGSTVHVTVTCDVDRPSSDKGQTAYNKTLADGMRGSYASQGMSPISAVSRANYGPFRNGYKFDWGTRTTDGDG